VKSEKYVGDFKSNLGFHVEFMIFMLNMGFLCQICEFHGKYENFNGKFEKFNENGVDLIE
jgi:hypothetical protein